MQTPAMANAEPSPPLYAIPGLGTDTRIFSRLQYIHPIGLEWLEPNPFEDISSYAFRMSEYIRHPNPILIGVSFGGVIAQEIARWIPIRQIILISSIKSQEELPHRFRLMQTLPIYQLSRGNWRIQTLPYWGKLFGIRDPRELRLIQDMFQKHSDAYRMWAIRSLINWQKKPINSDLIHLHGTSDKVFPIHRIKNCIRVESGDHFMVYRKAQEIEQLLRDCLI